MTSKSKNILSALAAVALAMAAAPASAATICKTGPTQFTGTSDRVSSCVCTGFSGAVHARRSTNNTTELFTLNLSTADIPSRAELWVQTLEAKPGQSANWVFVTNQFAPAPLVLTSDFSSRASNFGYSSTSFVSPFPFRAVCAN